LRSSSSWCAVRRSNRSASSNCPRCGDPEFDPAHPPQRSAGRLLLTHCFGVPGIVPGRFDKSINARQRLGHGLWRQRCLPEVARHVAGGAIYNNTSDEALPLALGRTFGAQDLDTTGAASSTTPASSATTWFSPRSQRRHPTVPRVLATRFRSSPIAIELHRPSRTNGAGRWRYVIKDWHATIRLVMARCRSMRPDLATPVSAPRVRTIRMAASTAPANAPAAHGEPHPGRARFRQDQDDSVLDPSCRAWQFDNLYVTDGACMPTSGGGNANPDHQANSFRVATF